MNLIKIKPERAFEISKATGIEFTYIDNNLNSIQIPTGDSFVRIQVESYSVTASEPAPPKKETKWRVHGTVLGTPIQKDFDEKYEASDYETELRNSFHADAWEMKADVKVEQVEVEIPLN